MFQTINNADFAIMLGKMKKAYMPAEEKKKKKMTLRQIFFLKGKGK